MIVSSQFIEITEVDGIGRKNEDERFRDNPR